MIDRSSILLETKEHFPELLNFTTFCYSNSASLFIENGEIIAIQQGDPLGPFLFSLVLQTLIKSINTKFPNLHSNLWYLDDGTIIGESTQLLEVFHFISEEGPTLGLHINPTKCSMYWPTSQEMWTHFPDCLLKRTDGTIILGSPVGSREFISDATKKKIISLLSTMDLIEDLDNSQMELLQILHWVSKNCPSQNLQTRLHSRRSRTL